MAAADVSRYQFCHQGPQLSRASNPSSPCFQLRLWPRSCASCASSAWALLSAAPTHLAIRSGGTKTGEVGWVRKEECKPANT
eukprot:s2900_g3.t1